ncbi:hypothetical protein RUND412_005077 [Rhizina undulata]
MKFALSSTWVMAAAICAIFKFPLTLASYTDPVAFKSTCLSIHNDYRSQHGAAPLVWNDELAAWALDHAQKCVFAHSTRPSRYGENLSANYPDLDAAIHAWGIERDVHDYGANAICPATGHFTQMVWKETTSVGCAAVECDALLGGWRGWLVVCQYDPPGNWEGRFLENVSPIVF